MKWIAATAGLNLFFGAWNLGFAYAGVYPAFFTIVGVASIGCAEVTIQSAGWLQR